MQPQSLNSGARMQDGTSASPISRKVHEWRKKAHRLLTQADSLLLQILDTQTRLFSTSDSKIHSLHDRLVTLQDGRASLESELSEAERAREIPSKHIAEWQELLYKLDKQIEKVDNLVTSSANGKMLGTIDAALSGSQDSIRLSSRTVGPPGQLAAQEEQPMKELSHSGNPSNARRGTNKSAKRQDRSPLYSFGEFRGSPSSSNTNTPAIEPSAEQVQAFNQERQIQARIIADQDSSLDQLHSILKRQQHVGIAMNTELEQQNALLSDMEEAVDFTDRRLANAQTRVGKLLGKMGQGQRSCFLILGLFLLLVLIMLLIHVI